MAAKGQRSHNDLDRKKYGEEIVVDEYGNDDTHHEEGDINVTSVYKFLLWLLVGMIFTYALVYGIMKWNDGRAEKMDAQVTHVAKVRNDRLPPEPRLQLAPGHVMHPLIEGKNYRDSMTHMLHSYAYMNKQTGAVRLSIDRAKELLIQRGLPTRQTDVQSANVDLIPEFTNGGRTYIQRDMRIPGTTNAVPATQE